MLPRINVPVLVIAADQDSTTTPDASLRMKQSIPHAKLFMATPAKHLGPLERNVEYNREIDAFAASCLGAAPTQP